MKTKIKYYILVFAMILLAGTSCSDFLDENNRTGSTEDLIYSTKNGIDGLVAACYSYTRSWYGKEAAYGLSEGGTDTWLTGYDNRQKVLINYTGITPEVATTTKETMNACFDEYWELLYGAVNLCNTGIKYVNAASSSVLSDDQRNAYLGELKALRAFYYWHLVETWGPVQINTEPITTASTIGHRNSEEDVYNFMLNDVDEAIVHLAKQTAKTGRINIWAAKALRARLLLYQASQLGVSASYALAAAEAEEVISGSGCSFYSNYSDVWSATHVDGISNNEVIWYVDYSSELANNILPKRLKLDENGNPMNWAGMILRNAANALGGNASHLMFVGVWNSVPATSGILKRTDTDVNKNIKWNGITYNVGLDYQAYSKGFTRFVPSGYLLDVFNKTTDQRYQASFRDVYYVANAFKTAFAGGVAPPTGYANMRDTALYLCPNTVTAAQVARAAGRYVLFSRTDVGNSVVYPLYQSEAAVLPTIATTTLGADNYKGNRMYISLKKFDDISSTATVIRDLGDRDAFVFRLSEMYLIAAEGYMMSGSSVNAISRLNDLRNARAISGQDNTLTAAEQTQVNNKNIAVILDERARELCGEQQRWFDLKRTNTLLTRVPLYNGSTVGNIKDFHMLRPIPQPQMDAVSNRTESEDPNGFWQNPGY
ncbi:MAG TPA: RagB/SusD family nutrient uptake outer membrane protein [Bacteroidales bacterium]|nr:RagB/SusD family nutrient uptake outer membrane protein [Bacteroidales bacterium]HPT12750.1 RagB/SusD family nutrient uptake outer membrane protein [Bacteroidales bacterium]